MEVRTPRGENYFKVQRIIGKSGVDDEAAIFKVMQCFFQELEIGLYLGTSIFHL